MGYLNGTLTLHDVRDVEAFCTNIIQRRNLQLSPHEHEDLIAYLIEEAWILSTRYRQGGITFSTWAGNTLRNRLIDRIRTTEGRTIWRFSTHTYQRPRPTLISTNTELGQALLERTLDSTEPSPPSLDGLHRAGPGTRPPGKRRMGTSTTRRAA